MATRLVALDLDGVVYLGDQVLPGVREALEDVLRRDLDLRYVTNNSTRHRRDVSELLTSMGLPAGTERILTSGFVAGQWLRTRLPKGALVAVMGESGLLSELSEAGFAAYHIASEVPGVRAHQVDGQEASAEKLVPAAVVVGMDRSISFGTLTRAQAALRNGALFVATNPDATFPTLDGVVPGAGAIVAAVATAAGTTPIFMGKPGLVLAETLATVTGIPSSQTLFIGDRLETDIVMGHSAGMTTTLVLTGVTSEADLESEHNRKGGVLPDHVLTNLGELPSLLDSLGA